MIELLPFTKKDFELFKSWIHTEEELVQFAGPIFSYPLDDLQLNAYLEMIDIKPFKIVLRSTKETIGHCELNLQDGKNRLSRVLIGDKDLRGQKIGEQTIRKMSNMLFENSSVTVVDLHVFEWNVAAVKCYEKVGFKINDEISEDILVDGKCWRLLNMVLNRVDYIKL